MRFLVSGFWLDGQPFQNKIATSENGVAEDDDSTTFVRMDEQDIIDAMSPNEHYNFIITSYRAL